MISFATKLHILLIMMVIGIGLYMFLLYKEVKMFSEDIDILREEIAALKGPVGASCPLSAPSPSKVPASSLGPEPVVIVEDDEDQEDDDDDDASVTSNEIKNILTNIREKEPEVEAEKEQEDEEQGEEEEQVLKPVANTPDLSVANTPNLSVANTPNLSVANTHNLSLLTVQELQKCKYEELRLYLRDNGVNMTKGTKLELIQKIHGLRKQ